MKILSRHDNHNIITYWNNEFIAKDTLSKSNAMYLNKAHEFNIIFYNGDAISAKDSDDFKIHVKSIKITKMMEFINDVHWGLQTVVVIVIILSCFFCCCGICFKKLKGIKKPNDDNYNDYAQAED